MKAVAHTNATTVADAQSKNLKKISITRRALQKCVGWACLLLESIDTRSSVRDKARIKSSSTLSLLLDFVFMATRITCLSQNAFSKLHVVRNVSYAVWKFPCRSNFQHIGLIKKKRIITFGAQELPPFSIEGQSCNMCSISITPGRGPQKVIPLATAHRLRNPASEPSPESLQWGGCTCVHWCRGLDILKFDKNSTIAFRISVWGVGALFGGKWRRDCPVSV